ncbi:MAG TPA: ABC transporter permease [Luteitalea sp.]|nr:ABC transporter permease [Luteitalea sp.]
MTDRLRETWERVKSVAQRDRRDADFEAELESHMALATADFEAQGLGRDEARRKAAQALGGRDAAREGHRDARGLPWFESVVADVRYALRRLVKAPGFALSVAAILAIGIGANTAIFSVVNAIVLRPLPFANADRLVWIAPDTDNEGQSELTYPVAIAEGMARGSTTLDGLTTYFPFYGYFDFVLSGRGDAERLAGMPVGRGFFEMLGVAPAKGRLFSREELQPNGPKAMLLTHATWQRTFGSDPTVVGQSVTVSEQPYTVIGVLPASFDFASTFMPGARVDMFVPADYELLRNAGNVFAVVGRLKPGVPLSAARAEFQSLMPRISEANAHVGTVTARLTALDRYVNARIHSSLLVLWGAVGLVLLIACANLSGLLLARTASRSKEIAVRLAIGAGRGRIVRQLLTESIVLSSIGAALGIPLAYALVRYVKARPGLSVPLLHLVEIDGMALLFTAVLAVASSVFFGLLPAARIAAGDPQRAMRSQTRGSTQGRGHAWLRSGLVVVEVALACVLLVGAGLMLRTFLRVQAVDLGFAPSQVVALRLNTRPGMDNGPRRVLVDEVTRRVAALPGVEAAGVSDALPLDRNRTWGVGAPGRTYPPGENPQAYVYITGPGYLRAMNIRLREGRDFTTADTADTDRVAVINETLAQSLYPGQTAVGRDLQNGNRTFRIIGVVSDVRQTSLENGHDHQMYFSYTQVRDAGLDLIVRTNLPAATIAPAIRRALGELDPSLSATDVRTLDTLVDRAISPRRFLVALLGGFSLIALVLACVGIYSTVAFTVGERVREFGVRMALGASSNDIRQHVLRQTLLVAGLGVAVGAVASFLVGRVMASLLYETSAADVTTFGVTALVLTGVAALAAYIPAMRASRVSPMEALRGD